MSKGIAVPVERSGKFESCLMMSEGGVQRAECGGRSVKVGDIYKAANYPASGLEHSIHKTLPFQQPKFFYLSTPTIRLTAEPALKSSSHNLQA